MFMSSFQTDDHVFQKIIEKCRFGPCDFCRFVIVQAHTTGGRLAQLVERFVYTEDVGSSSLSSPTIFFTWHNDVDFCSDAAASKATV
jgi:hypothetical protein